MKNKFSIKNTKDYIDLAKKNHKALSESLLEVFALYNLSKNLSISLQMDSIFAEVGTLLEQTLGINDFSIMLLDESGDNLTVWKANNNTQRITKDISFRLGEGVSGLVAQKGRSILIQDVTKDPRFLYYKSKISGIGSFLSIPLKVNNSRILGVFNIHKKEKNGFKKNDVLFYKAAANHIAQALQNSKTFQETRKMAITDDLTEVHSRRFFIDALRRQMSNSERQKNFFSIIMIDIDFFKSLNDRFGHSTGDEILIKVAKTLSKLTRKGDTIARYGGDEFIVLLPGVDIKKAKTIAEKFRADVENYINTPTDKSPIPRVTISAGVCTYPRFGRTVSEMVDSVDEHLYQAKKTGRNKVCSEIKRIQIKTPNENRKAKRYPLGLRIIYEPSIVQYVDIDFKGKWMMCMLEDISQKGFRGNIEFFPKIGEEFNCKVISDSKVILKETLFKVRVVYKKKKRRNKYSIGFEIIVNQEGWRSLFEKITM